MESNTRSSATRKMGTEPLNDNAEDFDMKDDAEEGSYSTLRKAVKEHRETMKEYYKVPSPTLLLSPRRPTNVASQPSLTDERCFSALADQQTLHLSPRRRTNTATRPCSLRFIVLTTTVLSCCLATTTTVFYCLATTDPAHCWLGFSPKYIIPTLARKIMPCDFIKDKWSYALQIQTVLLRFPFINMFFILGCLCN